MKYRKILVSVFWPTFIAFFVLAITNLVFIDYAAITAADIHKVAVVVVGVILSLISLLVLISSREIYFEWQEYRKQATELPPIIQRLQAEILTKDTLLAREKEILLKKHKKIEEAFAAQKRVNDDLERLQHAYENIIELNKTVWFMDSPLGVLELIADEAIKAVEADRAVIVINDEKGAVSFVGTSVVTEQQREPLNPLLGQTAFNRPLMTLLESDRLVRLERSSVPHPIAAFLACGAGADCFGFAIRFHKELRGAAFIATRRDSGLIVRNLTLLEMFFSIVSVYLERNELIGREHDINDILSEQEKMSSLTHLIEGIARNVSTPLNAVRLSREATETTINSLAAKYPDEVLVSRLRKMTERSFQSADAADHIVASIARKAAQDKVERADHLDLNELVRAELTFLEADIEFQSGYERSTDLAENLPLIFGLYRDFSYLIDAHAYLAMHFLKNEETRRMLFRTRPTADGVLFSIGMSGGVTVETLQKIFAGADRQHIARVNIPTLNQTIAQIGITRQLSQEKEMVVITLKIPVRK
ncbi:MAG TPA: hypothetical protein P5077_10710 [bacterium]|nr:hypothetical protein [bacterium]